MPAECNNFTLCCLEPPKFADKKLKQIVEDQKGSEVFHDTIAAQMIKLQKIVNYFEQKRLFLWVWYGFHGIFP